MISPLTFWAAGQDCGPVTLQLLSLVAGRIPHLLAIDLFFLMVMASFPFSWGSWFQEVLALLLLLFQVRYIFHLQLLDIPDDFVSQAEAHLAVYMSKGVSGTLGGSC